MDAATPPISFRGITKTYRVGFWLSRQVHALQHLELAVQPGQVYGLLGPNGAGKSTAIKILLNLVQASSGVALLFGQLPRVAEARRAVGYVPENPSPYEYLSGREFLALSARLAGLTRQEGDRRVEEVLGEVEMTAAAKLQIRRYSKGMVQRIALAQALIGRPSLLVLDEPTSGLDPLGRRQIRDIILAERARGTTVLFCSHIIPDVESLCDRVAVLVGGRLVKEGTVQSLLSQGVHEYELVVESVTEPDVRALAPEVTSIQALEGRLLVRVAEAQGEPLLRALLLRGARVTRYAPVRFGLEDLFMRALGEAGRHVGGEISG